MLVFIRNISIISVLLILTSIAAYGAEDVSMTVSEKEGYIRIEFDCLNALFVNDAAVIQSYSLIKITFPNDFTFKQLSGSQLIQKVSQKGNSLYLNIDNLNSFNTITLASPPRLVLDAYIKETPQKRVSKEPYSVVIIDPGHGGNDTGVLVNGHSEGSVDLDIALGMQDALKAFRYKVIYTRNIDRSVSISDRISETLKQKGFLFVSIHLSRTHSCVIYTSKFPSGSNGSLNISGNDLYNLSYSQIGFLDRSKKLAEKIGNAIKSDNGIDIRYLEMPISLLSSVYAPAVMIELPYEIGANKNIERNKKIVNSIVQGIDKFVKE